MEYYEKFSYEGEYLNGEKNGKGKEYDIYGREIFEGEYLNGKRNGKGKEYNFLHKPDIYMSITSNNLKIVYEGDYLDGEKHGKRK